MRAQDGGSLANRVYRRLMGVGSDKLTQPAEGEESIPVRLRDVLYYGYEKGAWQLARGTLFRARLRSSGRRFFLGRGTRLLFPNHLAVGNNVAIGDYVSMNCFGRNGVKLGNNVRIREYTSVVVSSHLSHPGVGLEVGDGTYIGPHCILGASGGIRLGKDVTFGANVQLLAENHEFSDAFAPINEQGVTRRGIEVSDGCWFGNGVIVLDGVHVGANAVVGAGSVVTRDIPDRAIAVGNPARVLRVRS